MSQASQSSFIVSEKSVFNFWTDAFYKKKNEKTAGLEKSVSQPGFSTHGAGWVDGEINSAPLDRLFLFAAWHQRTAADKGRAPVVMWANARTASARASVAEWLSESEWYRTCGASALSSDQRRTAENNTRASQTFAKASNIHALCRCRVLRCGSGPHHLVSVHTRTRTAKLLLGVSLFVLVASWANLLGDGVSNAFCCQVTYQRTARSQVCPGTTLEIILVCNREHRFHSIKPQSASCVSALTQNFNSVTYSTGLQFLNFCTFIFLLFRLYFLTVSHLWQNSCGSLKHKYFKSDFEPGFKSTWHNIWIYRIFDFEWICITDQNIQ